jgi:diguanylate cyclase (GGDEF)-like protein/PAS domain S-box-containing protein
VARDLLGQLIQEAPIGVLLVHGDGRLFHANAEAIRLLGLDSNRLLAAYRSDLFRLADRLAAVARDPQDQTAARRVHRVERADGQSLWIEFSISPVGDQLDGSDLAAVFLTDLSRQYHLEQALRAKSAGLDLILSRAPIAIAITDGDRRVNQWNAGCEGLFGPTPIQAVGRTLEELSGIDRAVLHELAGRALAGAIVRDIEVRTRAGERDVDLRVSVAAAELPNGAVSLVWICADTSAEAQAHADLRASESRLRKILQHINDTVTIIDPEGRTRAATGLVATTPILGYGSGQWDGLDVFQLLHPDDYEWAGAALRYLLEAPGNRMAGEVRIRDAAGEYQAAEGWGINLLDDPDVAGILITTRNVSERKRNEALVAGQAAVLGLVAEGAPLEDALRRLVGFVEELVAHTGVSAVLVDDDGGVTRAVDDGRLSPRLAKAAVAALGAQGTGPLVLEDLDGLASFAELADGLRAAGWQGLWTQPVISGSSGRPVAVLVLANDRPRAPGESDLTVLAVAADMAAIAIDRERAEQRLADKALHDELTGLANRHLLLDRLELAIARAGRRGRNLALMFLDLDHFKLINDSLGHEAGDEVLRMFGERLRLEVRPEDTVARFGGDEFVVLVEQVVDEHDVNLIAERLERCLDEPFVVGGNELYVTASVGIVIAKGGDEVAATLLRNADTAMYRAKELGRNRLEIFDEHLRAELLDRLRLETDLRRAIERDELEVAYQPILDLASGKVAIVEALLRWRHPDRGLLLPGSFLPIAEDSGLIVGIGRWVVEQACTDLLACPGAEQVALAVNLSARQVAQPDLADQLAEVLRRLGLGTDRLVVEILETALLEDSDTVSANLASLRALGVRLAIDDFGTGFSSLSSLHRVPVDILKIDRSFVAALGMDPATESRRPIVHALVSMCQALGLQVVAEGVERPDQLAELRALGCHLGQGFAFSEAVGPSRLADLLRPGAFG